MKILIDTNVLISAILKDGQPENAILWIIKHIEWEWLASPDIMLEYQEVLRRKKFKFPIPLIQHWSELLNNSISIIRLISPETAKMQNFSNAQKHLTPIYSLQETKIFQKHND